MERCSPVVYLVTMVPFKFSICTRWMLKFHYNMWQGKIDVLLNHTFSKHIFAIFHRYLPNSSWRIMKTAWPLKIGCPEKSAPKYLSVLHNTPQEKILHSHSAEAWYHAGLYASDTEKFLTVARNQPTIL